MKRKLDNALNENTNLRQTIEKLEQQRQFISYDELKPGCILDKHVKDFTFFRIMIAMIPFLICSILRRAVRKAMG